MSALKRRFVVGIDYGTAYAAVAYAVIEPGVDSKSPTNASIKMISRYPYDGGHLGMFDVQVPNASCYLADSQLEYGYSLRVQNIQGRLNPIAAPYGYIERAKLMLSTNRSTEDVRQGLSHTIARLKADGIINADTDIIRDKLAEILRHTKAQLTEREKFSASACDVEFIVTVPPTWRAQADAEMISALSSAAVKVGFANASDLFLVSETEAAVNFLVEKELWNDENLEGRPCTVLDCGGATCDIASLVVNKGLPVRLDKAMIEEDGEQ